MEKKYILFDQGKKLGEISGWVVTPFMPFEKNILGKIIKIEKGSDECTFVSPKPVNRRSELVVVEDGKKEFSLQVKSVKGTTVLATIVSEKRRK